MPGHLGYETLVKILNKEGNSKDAVKYCLEAKKRGWTGDWDEKIEKYSKALNL